MTVYPALVRRRFSPFSCTGLAVFIACISVMASAEEPEAQQPPPSWYEVLQYQLHLPSAAGRTLGALRLYRSDRKGIATVTDMTVLPDNATVRLVVIKARLDGEGYRQMSRTSRDLPRSTFEKLKSAILDAMLPRDEWQTANPAVYPGDILVCADGPLAVIEVALSHPTPLYLRREADCTMPDPVLAAGNMLDAFAGTVIRR